MHNSGGFVRDLSIWFATSNHDIRNAKFCRIDLHPDFGYRQEAGLAEQDS